MHLVILITTMNSDRDMRRIVSLQCRIDVPSSHLAKVCISRSGQSGKRLLVYLLTIDGGSTIQVSVCIRVVLPHEGQTVACNYRGRLIGLLEKRMQREEGATGN